MLKIYEKIVYLINLNVLPFPSISCSNTVCSTRVRLSIFISSPPLLVRTRTHTYTRTHTHTNSFYFCIHLLLHPESICVCVCVHCTLLSSSLLNTVVFIACTVLNRLLRSTPTSYYTSSYTRFFFKFYTSSGSGCAHSCINHISLQSLNTTIDVGRAARDANNNLSLVSTATPKATNISTTATTTTSFCTFSTSTSSSNSSTGGSGVGGVGPPVNQHQNYQHNQSSASDFGWNSVYNLISRRVFSSHPHDSQVLIIIPSNLISTCFLFLNLIYFKSCSQILLQ